MSLLDKLSRNKIDFHGVNFEDLSEYLNHNPHAEIFPVAVAPYVISFMNDNPNVVIDGHFSDHLDLHITGISGRTTKYSETSYFNIHFHEHASAFYMKGLTIFAEFEASDGRN